MIGIGVWLSIAIDILWHSVVFDFDPELNLEQHDTQSQYLRKNWTLHQHGLPNTGRK
jgi:hypothetical protein